MAAILKIQNGRHNDIEKNGKIGFHTLTFPKIYSFTNPPKPQRNSLMEHSEPD
jgi:hypothetical protein